MSFPKERKSPMEKKGTDGKMKSVASIPDNYVSILQLQERWIKEKEGKHKERDFEVEVNGQRRREEAKVSAVVSKKKGEEDGGCSRERKKKKNQGGSVKEVVKCGSKAYIPREIEKTPGEKTVQNRENAAAAAASSNSIAVVETQFQHHLQIKKSVEEDRQAKGPVRLKSGQGYYRYQKHETRNMVWVKKGE